MIESLDLLISALDSLLDTKRKRHIVGGISLSFTLLLGGLTFTIITMKTEE